MSDDPVKNTPERENRIRERAYSFGKPMAARKSTAQNTGSEPKPRLTQRTARRVVAKPVDRRDERRSRSRLGPGRI